MAKGKREIQEVNAGSMADIAFLLLVFFLVTTTMNQNQGVKATLPPFVPPEEIPPIQYNQNDILEILVDKQDRLLVENELLKITDLRAKTIEFLTNNGKNPKLASSSEKAVISLRNDRGTSYAMYVKVQNELSAAYRTVRDQKAMELYGETYTEIHERFSDPESPTRLEDKEKIRAVKDVYPMKLSETEPETVP